MILLLVLARLTPVFEAPCQICWGKVGLIWCLAGMTHFTPSFFHFLGYQPRLVLVIEEFLELQERGLTLMNKCFFKSLHFYVCVNGQSRSHRQAESQYKRRQSMWKFGVHDCNNLSPKLCKASQSAILAWKNIEEGIFSGVALRVQLTWEQLDILLVSLWYQMVLEGDMINQSPHISKLAPSHPMPSPWIWRRSTCQR